MQTALKELAGGFERNRMAVAKAIREIREQDPQGFVSAALRLLAEAPEGPIAKYLLAVLLAQPEGIGMLCDPELFSAEQSILLVQQAKQLDAKIEGKLAALIACSPFNSGRETNFATRVMDVLDRSADPSTILPAMRQFLQCPNPHIRSKAALLIGRISRNPQWAQWTDPLKDKRVAANALESLWGLDTAAAKAAFRAAALPDEKGWQSAQSGLPDSRNRMAGNGAVGLYLAGDFDGVCASFRLSRHGDPLFRATGAWAMGHVGDPRFLPRLKEMTADPDETVRLAAKRAMAELKEAEHRAKEIGTIALQIRMACWEGTSKTAGTHKIDLMVGDGSQETGRLTALQFVVRSGGVVVEEFKLNENRGTPVLYHLTWEGALPESREIKVEVYSKRGWGMDMGLELAF